MSNDDTVRALVTLSQETIVTRENFEKILDWGRLEAQMANGNWWAIRRNGRTQLWKSDPKRIRVPVKAGLRVYAAISETDFLPDGRLNPAFFRMRAP